jgi:hypothetical protein
VRERSPLSAACSGIAELQKLGRMMPVMLKRFSNGERLLYKAREGGTPVLRLNCANTAVQPAKSSDGWLGHEFERLGMV